MTQQYVFVYFFPRYNSLAFIRKTVYNNQPIIKKADLNFRFVYAILSSIF